MQDATVASAASSPLSISPRVLRSSPPDNGEDALMRAANTPMESSPAPTGFSIEVGQKRKRTSGKNVSFGDDEDDEEDANPRKKGKGRKVGTGKSVCWRYPGVCLLPMLLDMLIPGHCKAQGHRRPRDPAHV